MLSILEDCSLPHHMCVLQPFQLCHVALSLPNSMSQTFYTARSGKLLLPVWQGQCCGHEQCTLYSMAVALNLGQSFTDRGSAWWGNFGEFESCLFAGLLVVV